MENGSSITPNHHEASNISLAVQGISAFKVSKTETKCQDFTSQPKRSPPAQRQRNSQTLQPIKSHSAPTSPNVPPALSPNEGSKSASPRGRRQAFFAANTGGEKESNGSGRRIAVCDATDKVKGERTALRVLRKKF